MSSWNSQNRLVTAYPGPRDSFVVTLGDGRRIGLCSVDEYEAALARANKLVRDTKLAVKVLPMTVAEFINFAGITASDLAASPEADAGLRQLVVTTLREIMLDSDDRATRVEARGTLYAMGEAGVVVDAVPGTL